MSATDGAGLELVLFARRPPVARRALDAGLGSLIVDLEWRGKERRQAGAGTEINRDRPHHLEVLRDCGVPRRWCRLDALGPWTGEQLEEVLAAGATHVLLPMVRTVGEAEELLRRVDGRAAAGILVETEEAVEAARELGRLPLDLAYVGLNDLAIARRSGSIFDAVADGTVEHLRGCFPDGRFGFGGVTVADGGAPVPCRLLLAEMARLDTGFCFLRRSFRRDTGAEGGAVPARPWGPEVAAIGALWVKLRRRSATEVEADHRALLGALEAAPATPAAEARR